MKKERILVFLCVLLTCSGLAHAINVHSTIFNQYETIEPYRLTVGFIKTVHVTFPAKVKYVDLGSNYVIAAVADETENVVRIKAAYKDFPDETSCSVICEDGSFYTFIVTYKEHPDKLYYEMSAVTSALSNKPNNRSEIILRDIAGESPILLNMIIRSIYNRNLRDIVKIGESNFGIDGLMKGIYVYNDMLYFHLEVKNTTDVTFDIDYIRFTVRDKKTLKKQASQEYSVTPVREYNHNSINRAIGRGMYRTVFAFNKFTIASDKVLSVEIVEKNGARNIQFTISPNHIINAQAISNIQL